MRIYTLLIFILFSATAFSQKQTATYLQQFKFRTPNFRSVLFSGNANGAFNTPNGSATSPQFALNPKLEATKIVSTDKVLASYTYQVSAAFNHNSATIATGVQSNTNFDYSIIQSASKKLYKQANYFQTGFSTLVKQSFANSTNNFTERGKAAFSSIAFTIGVGKGRIENVTDAQMAYNILNDLKKNNLLAADFSKQDVNGLAQTITQLNNTRLFDFRRKHIFELKQIDSFLNAKGLVKEKSIDYFTTVNDNWFYAFNELRRHGKEKFITLSPSIGLNNTKSVFNILPVDSTTKYFSKFAGAILSIGVEKAKALSIKKQFNKGLSLLTIYGYSKNKTTFNSLINQTTNSNIFSGLLGYLQWGYYPNTRTNINTTVSNLLVWQIENDAINNNTSINFSGNYFINFNTRVFVNVSSNLNINRSFNTDFNAAATASFGFGIQHYIR